MAHIHENTRARRQALQLLYQHELTEGVESEDGSSCVQQLVISELPKGVEEAEVVGEKVRGYAEHVADGVIGNLARIDAWIEDTAQNWKLDRMPVVDRNIIRLAAYEIGYCDDIPTGVAINEAVEVAKAFGGDDSPKFVNGVLGRIADIVEREGVQPLPEPGEEDVEAPSEGAEPDAAASGNGAQLSGPGGSAGLDGMRQGADSPVGAHSCAPADAATQDIVSDEAAEDVQ